MRKWAATIVCGFGLAAAAPSQAQERGARADDAAYTGDDDSTYVPAPRDRLWYSNASYLRINPLGLVNQHRVGWRRRLSTKDSLLFRDTYAFVGPAVTLTPAWARGGLYGEAQLLAVLRVFTEVMGVGYFGTFDQVLTFPEDGRYSDQTIEAQGDRAEPTGGWVWTIGTTVRAAVGPIAVRSTVQGLRFDLGGVADGAFFYDQLSDRLAPDEGWVVLNDADLLYLNGKVRAGVRHSFSDNLGGSSGTDAATAYHRVGPLFAYQFADHAPGKRFNQPTLFLLAQTWVQHPYRTGDEQSQALPLIAAGFAFNGDYKTSP